MTAMRKRRVCCFCEKWESGGIESFLCNILLSMDLSRLEVDIVAAQMGESVFTEPLKAHGVGFYELAGRQNDILRSRRAFRKLLEKRRYDVVHLNLFQGLSLYYAKLAQEAGVPVRIAHSHNTDLRKSPTRVLKLALHRWAGRRYGKAVTHRWACSQAAAEFLFGSVGDFTFIPNGIDTGRFRYDPDIRVQVRERLGLGDALVIGNVGRLCEQKNQSFLLDVFALVHSREPNSRLLLVGEGEDLPALREKAEHLKIGEKVVFYGVSGHIEELFWAMDVFAFPSWFEGFGIVAIEAQAAGLPVVASEFVPQEAKVAERFQTVRLERGAREWAAALLECREDDTDRAAEAAVVRQAGFDVQAVAERVWKLWMR